MHAYSTDGSRVTAYGVMAGIAVVLAVVAAALFDQFRVGPAWLVSSPTVAGSFALLYRWMDSTGWRSDSLRKVGLVDTPNIAGKYAGHLVSSYNPIREVPIALQIDQRWTKIYVRMEVTGSTTSTSESVAAALDAAGDSAARLTYTYKSDVQPGEAHQDMHDHDGTAELHITPGAGTAAGRYFNARGHQGRMTVSRA